MKLTNEFFSVVAENDQNEMVFVTCRDQVDNFRTTKKLKERIEIYWKYTPTSKGLPNEEESKQMEEMQEKLTAVVEKDKLAILTGVYTGNAERTFVYYARTSKVFFERLNDCLHSMPVLPLEFYVEIDPDWEEYLEMLEFAKNAEQ